jgi:hypothetical protein
MISASGAQVIGPASGGKVSAFNTIGSSPIQVLAPNQYRMSLTFHVPSTGNDILVAPVLNANGAALTISTVLLGGGFRIFAGGTLILTGECQGAWQALAITGANQSLTVMESNV